MLHLTCAIITLSECGQNFMRTSFRGRARQIAGSFSIGGHMTEKEFIDSKAWRKKRAYILRRDKYQCQYCRRYGKRTEATEVHHIKHYADYPELGLADSNLVSLCHACHNKQHPEKGGTRRRERNSGR